MLRLAIAIEVFRPSRSSLPAGYAEGRERKLNGKSRLDCVTVLVGSRVPCSTSQIRHLCELERSEALKARSTLCLTLILCV